MSTSGVGNTSNASGTSATTDNWANLKPADFMNMLIAELQNQDPTQPMDSAQILQEVSQIDDIQTNTTLNSTLGSVALEQSMATASNMLGKTITGTDASGNAVSGPVSSIAITNGTASLTVNGTTVPFANITSITSS
jgi:flagellar basal-body rod modification protein FlgD